MTLNALNQKLTPHSNKSRGQALIEFSLILPLLLFMLLGIIDFGRMLFIYSNVSSSIRDAARNAEILGQDENGEPSYASCSTILEDATKSFLQDIANSDVRVLYYQTGGVKLVDTLTMYKIYTESVWAGNSTIDALYAANPNIAVPTNKYNWWELADFDCDSTTPATDPLYILDGNSAKLQTGDIMIVTVQTDVYFMTPILSNIFEKVSLTFRAQRSIVTNLVLIKSETDTDGDNLDDDWEFRQFGCVASGDYANGKYDGLVIRPNGLLVDPSTHAFWEETAGDGKTYHPESLAFGQDSDYFYIWAKEACEMEERNRDLYPDPENLIFSDYGEEAGCYINPDDSTLLFCPVQNLDEYGSADDPDGDNCNNGCEEITGGVPIEGAGSANAKDTDGDGLFDGEEVLTYGTDPTKWDTDGDGLSDGEEILTYFTNPKKGDSDGDGLNDYVEANAYIDGENLALSNADNEFVLDGNGNPTTIIDDKKRGGRDKDADNDGINDYQEYITGYSIPIILNGKSTTLEGTTNPMKADSDGDGFTDYEELNNDWWEDLDGDGLDDAITPIWVGDVIILDPNNADTDGDGINDFAEYQNFVASGQSASSEYYSNPQEEDTDGDGLKDGDEVPGVYGTYPNRANSDESTEGCAGPDGTGSYTYDDEFESIGPLVVKAANNLNPDGDLDVNGNPLTNGIDGNSDFNDANGTETVIFGGVTIELTDCVEIAQFGTNPYLSDTDNDGLSDAEEIQCPTLSPVMKDTNGDGVDDSAADLLNCNNNDTENGGLGDTLPDIWEGEFAFGCTYKDGTAAFLNPDGKKYDANGNYLNSTGSYPADCLNGDSTNYYLNFGPTDDPDNDFCDNLCELKRHTDPLNPDTDGDGLKDGLEIGSSPLIKDTDGDGIEDGPEVLTYHSNPLDTDSDNDGLTDKEEETLGIALSNADCDGNNNSILYSSDAGDPVNNHPLACNGENTLQKAIDLGLSLGLNGIIDSDTDGDGLLDGLEVNTYSTNPVKWDTDDDGLSDYEEIVIYGTDPKINDTDQDGLLDGEEVNTYLTDPNKSDTDNDGLLDGEEVTGFDMIITLTSGGTVTSSTTVTIPGYNPAVPIDPNDPSTFTLNPVDGDSDNDGFGDGKEVYLQGKVVNGVKVKDGSNPIDPDTDGDGTYDGSDGKPLDGSDIGDTDGDGLIDADEINVWLTNPNNPDTDGDGLGDKFETSLPLNIEYYSSAYVSGNPDGSYTGNIVLEGYSFDTDGDGLADSVEYYLYEIVTGGTVSVDVQTVIDTILNDADPNNDNSVQCLYYDYSDAAHSAPNPPNGLHPGNFDTDGDGLSDGDECNVYLTNPLDATDENAFITAKIPNVSFRDTVYLALEHKYNVIAVTAIGTLDAQGRYPIAIVRTWNGTAYEDITTAITGSCGTTATYDGSSFTTHTNVCGILDTNFNNNATDQVWYAWVAPSAIYTLIQDSGIVIVNPNN